MEETEHYLGRQIDAHRLFGGQCVADVARARIRVDGRLEERALGRKVRGAQRKRGVPPLEEALTRLTAVVVELSEKELSMIKV